MKSIYSIKISLFISFFFIISNLIIAQVIYTDITPDHGIYQEDLELDLNKDGIIDLKFHYGYSSDQWGTSITTTINLYHNTKIASDANGIISQNDSIFENIIWNNSSVYCIQNIHNGGYTGEWDNIRDGFIAIRLNVNDQYYYAWVRLHILDESYYDLAVAGYAINTEPNQVILAGEGIPSGATSVFGSDEHNHFDGRGIRVSFTTDFNRELFSEYRIFVALSDDENALNLEYMSQLSEEYYLSIPIDVGTFFEVFRNLYENSISIDGETIKGLTDYRIHILNISNSEDPTLNVLSTPSDIFHLKEPLNATEIEIVMDIDNTASAQDIYVIFNEEQNSPPVEEYRAFIVKTENSSEFNTEIALQLNEQYYTNIPVGHHYNRDTLTAEQIDASGETIIEDQSYNIFILSVADSITSQTSILSEPSREIILAGSNSFYAGQKEGENVSWYTCDSVFSNRLYWGERWGIDYERYSSFDINRDGINDFEAYGEYDWSWTGDNCDYRLTGLRNNKILVCDHDGHENWIDVLQYHNVISTEYPQSSENTILVNFLKNTSNLEYVYYFGHLDGFPSEQGEYYIGLIINDNDTPQAAWIKMDGNEFIEYGFQDFSVGNTLDSCLTDGIQFSTQAELEQFTIDYPNCKHIEGEVIFEGEDITNLDAFQNIISIDGNLIIRNCPQLSDINGIQNIDLNTLNSIEITNNQNLSECDIENICQYLSDNGNIFIENNKEGCQDNAEVKSICTSSLAELKTYNWEINPNPANQFINITAISNIKIKSTLKIVNSLGSVVEALEMNHSESIINIENYPAGLYYIQISNSDGLQETHKLIIR